MPFCPNCKYEYQKNIEFCSDCGAKLVEELKKEPEEVYDNEAFLTSVADEIQASIIISKLTAFEIPVLKKYKDAGSFMTVIMGNTLYGIDLYVPSKLLELAKEALSDDLSSVGDENDFDGMMNDFGFDDIDNLDFDDVVNERDTGSSDELADQDNDIPAKEGFTMKRPVSIMDDAAGIHISHKKRLIKIFIIVTSLLALLSTIYSLLHSLL